MKEEVDYHSGKILQALRLLKGLKENELADVLSLHVDDVLLWEASGLPEESQQVISEFFEVNQDTFSVRVLNKEMLVKLANVELSRCSLETEFQKRVEEYKLNNPKVLDLSGLGLKSVPSQIFSLNNLTKINLTDNLFTCLHNELIKFSKSGGQLLLDKNFLSKEDKEKYGTTEIKQHKESVSDTPISDNIKLTRLRLKNIGIYEDITINFQDTFTVFVGVNGAGKTTILKALSLAIIGVRDSIKDNISSLRKINTPQEIDSTITLSATVNQQPFENTVSLHIDPDTGEAQVRGSSFKELYINDHELKTLILCLSEQRNSGRPTTDNYPSKVPRVKDLLPLIRNQDQACIHDFTSWWANLEAKKSDFPEHQKTIDLCFEIFSKFIGSEIRSAGLQQVKPETELWVEYANERRLPFKLESQGYQTAMGWIGFIVQRVVESYEHLPQPLRQPSIIIIDEIDQLLSVKWQQSVLSVLKEFFPNTQWILSTHSPMVLTDLEKDQIVKLQNIDGKIVADTNKVDLWMWQYGDIVRKFFEIVNIVPQHKEESLKDKIATMQKTPVHERSDNFDKHLSNLEIELEKVQSSRADVDPIYQQQIELHKREEELLKLIKQVKKNLER
ncbi:hypothetical protein PSECIP111951_01720 [Pseudoalteromonas holothuriae]|uniref:AAA+ ATPase domain-containing protein n=1 Tax=Pseudoalteromonas holothuriae TaxID=2963714 RepID=A0ABM9GHC1_9GAMM|nr:AAA family ATPase [Pseudoalteromonas sp. CIP111951]CAH9057693.1 hypothetical protein PSECIP111951_01720 [Pseudoalteromonas sp. CIP111951]